MPWAERQVVDSTPIIALAGSGAPKPKRAKRRRGA